MRSTPSNERYIMTQSTYSWMGTALHFVLEDDLATDYNLAQDAWAKAQLDYKARTGSNWNGTDSLWLEWTDAQQKAFNDIGSVINLLCKINGGSLNIREEDIKSEYLVKI